MGTPRPAPAEPLSARRQAQSRAGGLIRLSGRIPRRAGEHPINHHVTGASLPRRTQVRLAAPCPAPLVATGPSPAQKGQGLNH